MKPKKSSTRLIQISITVICCLALINCAVGPDFHAPDAPAVDRYTESQMPGKTVASQAPGGSEQRFNIKQDIPRQWCFVPFKCFG